MNRRILMTAFALMLGSAALAGGTDPAAPHGPDHVAPAVTAPAAATAEILGSAGERIGQASFGQGPHGVLIILNIEPGGLTPGWHGLHLHEKGDCSDPGQFTNSGGHHGKAEGRHGLLNPDGPEMGDLPNIWAAADGSAGYEAFSALFGLGEALDDDGIALVIHADRDDHLTQPIGGAGPRVACGVLTSTAE